MFYRARNSGALIIIVVMALVAMTVGKTFGQMLTLMTIMGWTASACLFVYLTLFKGVRLSFFKPKENPQDQQFEEFQMDSGGMAVEVPEGNVHYIEGPDQQRRDPADRTN